MKRTRNGIYSDFRFNLEEIGQKEKVKAIYISRLDEVCFLALPAGLQSVQPLNNLSEP